MEGGDYDSLQKEKEVDSSERKKGIGFKRPLGLNDPIFSKNSIWINFKILKNK